MCAASRSHLHEKEFRCEMVGAECGGEESNEPRRLLGAVVIEDPLAGRVMSRQLQAATALAASDGLEDVIATVFAASGSETTRAARVKVFQACMGAAGRPLGVLDDDALRVFVACVVGGWVIGEGAEYYKTADDMISSVMGYFKSGEGGGTFAVSAETDREVRAALSRIRRQGAFSHSQAVPADLMVLAGLAPKEHRARAILSFYFGLRPAESDVITREGWSRRLLLEDGVLRLSLLGLELKSDAARVLECRCMCQEAWRAFCPCALVADADRSDEATYWAWHAAAGLSGQSERIGAVQHLARLGRPAHRLLWHFRWRSGEMLGLYLRAASWRPKGPPDGLGHLDWLP